MYDGMMWRHSRQVEIVGRQTWLLVSRFMGTEEKPEDFAAFLSSYYQPEEKP